MASKNTEMEKEKYDAKLKAFLEAYDKAIEPVTKEHQMRMVPILQYGEQGVLPVFGVQNYITPVSKDEKRDKSKTDGQSD